MSRPDASHTAPTNAWSARPLTAGDLAAAVDVVSGAFAEYPYWRWLVADPVERASVLPAYYRADLADLLADGFGVEAGGRLAAVAIWTRGPWAGLDASPSTAVAGPAAARMGRALAAMSAMAPGEAHWYLDVLAVLPGWHGRGLGAAALAPGLARADAEGVGCYLETGRIENVRFYEGHRFAVSAECDVDDDRGGAGDAGSLHLWGMWRPPATRAAGDHL